IGEWLFPRRNDLRFYAALESAQIRIHELDSDPEAVLLIGPGWSYRREVNREQPDSREVNRGHPNRRRAHPEQSGTALNTTNNALPLSASPLNSLPTATDEPIAATPSAASESAPPHIEELGRRLAELLILWKKSRQVSSASKTPSRSRLPGGTRKADCLRQ